MPKKSKNSENRQNGGNITAPDALIKSVAELYHWLDSQIPADSSCRACGKCCNFREFGHLLFVTGPELMYLRANLREKLKQMTGDICPYNKDGKCTIHDYRFTGCRIFFCRGNADIQSQLTESALKQLKSLCKKFDIPYSYRDLKSALNNFNA